MAGCGCEGREWLDVGVRVHHVDAREERLDT